MCNIKDRDLEHPAITHTLATGYPVEPEPLPRCPICGEECERFYYNMDWSRNVQGIKTIVGCENCIDSQESYDLNWGD